MPQRMAGIGAARKAQNSSQVVGCSAHVWLGSTSHHSSSAGGSSD